MAAISAMSGTMDSTLMNFTATASSDMDFDPLLLLYGRPFSPKLVGMARTIAFVDPNTVRAASNANNNRVFLRDLGSGQGFMRNEQEFLYKCRRTYLHDDPDMSRAVPPLDFMSKHQLKRLMKVDDSKQHVTESSHLSSIHRWTAQTKEKTDIWSHEAPAEKTYMSMYSSQETSSPRATSSSSSSSRGPVLGKRRAKRRMMTPSQDEDRLRDEYEDDKQWTNFIEAGCKLRVHKQSGEVRGVGNISGVMARCTSELEGMGTGAPVYDNHDLCDLMDYLEGRKQSLA